MSSRRFDHFDAVSGELLPAEKWIRHDSLRLSAAAKERQLRRTRKRNVAIERALDGLVVALQVLRQFATERLAVLDLELVLLPQPFARDFFHGLLGATLDEIPARSVVQVSELIPEICEPGV